LADFFPVQGLGRLHSDQRIAALLPDKSVPLRKIDEVDSGCEEVDRAL
jgi:hypothetical protein